MNETEAWLTVAHFPLYQVSNLGRIRSSTEARPGEYRILSPGKNDGYFRVMLFGSSEKPKFRPLHQLILETFVSPRPDGMVSRHLNGNRTDNRVTNLAWGTRSENCKDAVLHGTFQSPLFALPATRKLGRAKLTPSQVIEIRSLLRQRHSQEHIAMRYGVKKQTISYISRGRYWRHVTAAATETDDPCGNGAATVTVGALKGETVQVCPECAKPEPC